MNVLTVEFNPIGRLLFLVLILYVQTIEGQTPCVPGNTPVADSKLNQDYGENWDPSNPTAGSIAVYRPAAGAVDNMLIDGFDAMWVFQNNGQYPNDPTTANPAETGSAITQTYPIQLYRQNGTFFRSARIKGYTSLTSEWGPSYLNGTAFLVRQSNDITVEDIRADRVWDGLRVSNSENTVFRNCWISHIRDDSIENDHLKGFTIENGLFEDAFVGISMRPSSTADSTTSGAGNLVTMINTHIYLTPYWYTEAKPNDTATIFKTSSSYVMPQMLLKDCVFGWEIDPTVNGPSNITNVLGNIHPDSGNNVALWMSLDPPPSWFYDENVLPSDLFTNKLIGQDAINFAENDKAAFKAQWVSDCRPLLEGDIDETLTINETVLENLNIMVYPNPVDDYLNIRIKNNLHLKMKFTLYDSDGKQIIAKDINTTDQPKVYVGALPTGIYFIRMEANGFVSIREVSKQ